MSVENSIDRFRSALKVIRNFTSDQVLELLGGDPEFEAELDDAARVLNGTKEKIKKRISWEMLAFENPYILRHLKRVFLKGVPTREELADAFSNEGSFGVSLSMLKKTNAIEGELAKKNCLDSLRVLTDPRGKIGQAFKQELCDQGLIDEGRPTQNTEELRAHIDSMQG